MAKYSNRVKGQLVEFESGLSLHQAVQILHVQNQAGNGSEFTQSLVDCYRRSPAAPSASQQFWIQYIATGQADRDRSQQAASTSTVDGSKLVQMFQAAQGTGGEIKLLSPVLYVRLAGCEVKLSLAKPHSKNPGSIYLTHGEEYLGKITPDGQLRPVKQLFDGLPEALAEFCQDPKAYAVKYGRITGRCCFCHLELTNRVSVYNGFGPVCARHWGIPQEEPPEDWSPSMEVHGRVTAQDLKDGA